MDFIIDSSFDVEKKRWDIYLQGEIDIFNSAELKNKLLELIEENNASLYIHCKNLEYMDSTALGSLVAVVKNVKTYGGEVHLKNVRPNIAKIFKITNLDKVFIIEGDKNE